MKITHCCEHCESLQATVKELSLKVEILGSSLIKMLNLDASIEARIIEGSK